MSASREFLSRQTKLSPASEEWAQLEYSLQLALGSPAPVLKHVWSVYSAHLALNFEKLSQNTLVHDSWIDTATLSDENRVDEVCGKGFKVPQAGLVFSVGTIKLQNALSYNRSYEFLLSKVCIGKSYVVNMETLEDNKVQIPNGYDSVYLYASQDDESSYQHNYLIQSTQQTLPCFLVHFELDPNREHPQTTPTCDMCNEAQATVYCESDEASLCHDCDEEHHARGNKLMQRHRRIAIQERPKKFGACPTHADSNVEFYCTTCKLPVCIQCKMIGSHSTPETASHNFIKIFDAYHRALAESKEPDPITEQRRSHLGSILSMIDDRVKEIKRNAEDVEAKIYQLLKEILMQLHEETQKKIDSLHSTEMEIRRELEELAWVESFLNYQQEVLSPSLFMITWGRHLNMRNSLHFTHDVPELSTVNPDLRLEGSVMVTSASGAKPKKKPQSEAGSIASSTTPKTVTSKFRSQLFNRYQLMNSPDRQHPSLKNLIPSKPMDALTLKFSKMLTEEKNEESDSSEG